jgi:hypothetical protein
MIPFVGLHEYSEEMQQSSGWRGYYDYGIHIVFVGMDGSELLFRRH